MAHTVRIQSRGRLTLPREVRRALQLEPGSEVVLQETAPGRYELKTEARTPALLQNRRASRLEVAVERSSAPRNSKASATPTPQMELPLKAP